MKKAIRISADKNPVGRPRKAGGIWPTLSVRVPPETIQAIDDWAAKNGTTRAQAVAGLVAQALKAKQK